MISIKQLNYAVAVGRTMQFKRAAEQCNISPSALSTSLNELETQIGMKIFERDTKKVLVTPSGERFLAKAEDILLQLEDLQATAQLNAAPLSAPMTVGFIPTIAPFLLPNLLRLLRDDYPDFALSVVEDQSHVLVEQVRSGAIDAAVLALPYPCEGLLSFEFAQEDFYWITQKSNELASLKEIRSKDMDEAQLMLLKEGHCLKDHVMEVCHIKHWAADHGFSATSLNTLVQMVAGGLGSTLVPKMALPQLVGDNSNLAAVHLDEPSPHRRLALIMRPTYPRISSIEALKEMCAQALA